MKDGARWKLGEHDDKFHLRSFIMCCKYRLGGCIPKFGPLPFQGPPKKNFRKAKIFPENVGDGEGGMEVDVIFRKQKSRNLSQNNFFPEISKIFSEEILHFLKISSMPGPPPRKLSPPFLLFFGGVTPPTPPPRWHDPVLYPPVPHYH